MDWGVKGFSGSRDRLWLRDATEEVVRKVQTEFVPIISKAPGFIAYYAVDAGGDVVTSVSVFRDRGPARRNPIAWRRTG